MVMLQSDSVLSPRPRTSDPTSGTGSPRRCGRARCLRTRQVGNRARDLQDAVVGAGAQPLLHHGALQQVLGVGAQLAILADLARAHLGVGVNALPCQRRSGCSCTLAGVDHALANVGRALRNRRRCAARDSSPTARRCGCRCGPAAGRRSSTRSAGSSWACSGTRACGR